MNRFKTGEQNSDNRSRRPEHISGAEQAKGGRSLGLVFPPLPAIGGYGFRRSCAILALVFQSWDMVLRRITLSHDSFQFGADAAELGERAVEKRPDGVESRTAKLRVATRELQR